MKIEMICTLTFTFSTKLENRGSLSVSKDDGGKVARWLHSHVQSTCQLVNFISSINFKVNEDI